MCNHQASKVWLDQRENDDTVLQYDALFSLHSYWDWWCMHATRLYMYILWRVHIGPRDQKAFPLQKRFVSGQFLKGDAFLEGLRLFSLLDQHACTFYNYYNLYNPFHVDYPRTRSQMVDAKHMQILTPQGCIKCAFETLKQFKQRRFMFCHAQKKNWTKWIKKEKRTTWCTLTGWFESSRWFSMM